MYRYVCTTGNGDGNMKLKPLLLYLLSGLKPALLDLSLILGFASLVYGCALYNSALGFAVGGIGAMAFALQCRKAVRSENDDT